MIHGNTQEKFSSEHYQASPQAKTHCWIFSSQTWSTGFSMISRCLKLSFSFFPLPLQLQLSGWFCFRIWLESRQGPNRQHESYSPKEKEMYSVEMAFLSRPNVLDATFPFVEDKNTLSSNILYIPNFGSRGDSTWH